MGNQKSRLEKKTQNKIPKKRKAKPKKSKDVQDQSGLAMTLEEALDKLHDDQKDLELLAKITHFNVKTLQQLFTSFMHISESKVDDGYIDLEEFSHALGAKQGLFCKRIFEGFNNTGNLQINFREFAMALSSVSCDATLEQKARFVFGLFDLDGDKHIIESELNAMLVATLSDFQTDLKLTSEIIDQICKSTIEEVDLNGDGKIDFSEYMHMIDENPSILTPYTVDIDSLLTNAKKRKKKMLNVQDIVKKYPTLKKIGSSKSNVKKVPITQQSAGDKIKSVFNRRKNTNVYRIDHLDELYVNPNENNLKNITA